MKTSGSFGRWAFGSRTPCRHPHPERPEYPVHAFDAVPGRIGSPRKILLLAAEIAAAGAVLHGIGFWSSASAWIVGGLAAIIAIEARG